MQTIIVTGGAGFIGSAIVRQLIQEHQVRVVNIDKLTYAADLKRLATVEADQNYIYEKIDICDVPAVERAFEKYQPTSVIHAAAETHVDRSIASAASFIQTNINGTYTLLETSRKHLAAFSSQQKQEFRFLQVSTDEVYGDMENKARATELSPYFPSSPYAASKASADHLVSSWARTYGLSTLVTHSSNNYGIGQDEEKLIPHLISKALAAEPLTIYGSGEQSRDWLHVDDNASAILKVLRHGTPQQTYNVASNHELTNIQVSHKLCVILDRIVEKNPAGLKSHKELITHVADRPGHDHRYALNTAKIKKLGWNPKISFDEGLEHLIHAHLADLQH